MVWNLTWHANQTRHISNVVNAVARVGRALQAQALEGRESDVIGDPNAYSSRRVMFHRAVV